MNPNSKFHIQHSHSKFQILNSKFKILLFVFFTLFFFAYLAFSNVAEAALIVQRPLYLSLASGLVGSWTFDGPDMAGNTAYDRSGQGNNGTLTNGPTRTLGNIGQALDFDGVDDWVNVGAIGSNFTSVAFWAYFPTQITSSFTCQQLIKYGSAGDVNNNQESITIGSCSTLATNETLMILGYNGSSMFRTYIRDTLNQGWNHIVISWNSGDSQYKFYVDGSAKTVYAGTQGNTPLTAIDDFRIGYALNPAAGADYFSGLLDEVRIYNRALSADEIQRLYRISATMKINKPFYSGSLTSGLVGSWSFDGPDMAGNTAYDRSGQGNNGILTPSGASGPTRTLGNIGQALNFDGSNDYVLIQDSANWDLAAGTIRTYASWINFSTLPGTGDWDSAISNPTFLYGFQFNGGGAGLVKINWWDGSTDHLSPAQSMSTNVWYYAAITVQLGVTNGSHWYLNGVDLGAFTAPNVTRAPTGLLISGTYSTERFTGKLDEVRIYNRALSADEIQRLYRIGATMKINKPLYSGSLADGLVGSWTFDGPDMAGVTAYDRSGQGNNGTLTNGPTRTLGQVGQALDFDGSDDYVRMNSRNNLDVSTFTASVWINPRLTSNDSGILYNAKLTDAWNGWTLTMDSGSLTCNDGDICLWLSQSGGLYQYVDYAYNFPTNTWSHWIVTFDNSTKNVKFYVNGIQVYNTTSTYSPAFGATITTQIGMGDGTYSGYFSGLIDEVRIYNRALSADEIRRLYNMGR